MFDIAQSPKYPGGENSLAIGGEAPGLVAGHEMRAVGRRARWSIVALASGRRKAAGLGHRPGFLPGRRDNDLVTIAGVRCACSITSGRILSVVNLGDKSNGELDAC
jgi:hypothetical protein